MSLLPEHHDEAILVAAVSLVESLNPAQRRRLASRSTFVTHVSTYDLRRLVAAVEALNADSAAHDG